VWIDYDIMLGWTRVICWVLMLIYPSLGSTSTFTKPTKNFPMKSIILIFWEIFGFSRSTYIYYGFVICVMKWLKSDGYYLKMEWTTWSWRSLHEWHVSNMDEHHLRTNEWLMFGNHEWNVIHPHLSTLNYVHIYLNFTWSIIDLQYVNKEYTYV